ncbi:hypothetical protein RND81_02G111600 [Saponaria officinalis]|uniref:Secreted protein n=1 Tax=Saponaria officinalis TaxID=3572 RepID=A0AAW1MLB8_SAPOF
MLIRLHFTCVIVCILVVGAVDGEDMDIAGLRSVPRFTGELQLFLRSCVVWFKSIVFCKTVVHEEHICYDFGEKFWF